MLTAILGATIAGGLVLLFLRRADARPVYAGYGVWAHGYAPGAGWRGRRRRRDVLRSLFVRLETSPAQERTILRILADVQAKMKAAKGEVGGTRHQLAALCARRVLERDALAALLAAQSVTYLRMGDALADALVEIHRLLAPPQRETLAALIDDGSLRHAISLAEVHA